MTAILTFGQRLYYLMDGIHAFLRRLCENHPDICLAVCMAAICFLSGWYWAYSAVSR